jgi:hypothetical protein
MCDMLDQHPRSATTADGRRLPELAQARLDPGTLDQLFIDIATCTKVIDVTAKLAATQMVPQQRLTLEAAHELIRTRCVRGVQIRYLYDGSEWWDTIIVNDDGVCVVRIQHA